MKHFSHLNTAVQLLERYKGEMPFSIFLKSFFAQHAKYGSKDRKRIAHICYCYFRLGQALKNVSVEERALIGLFLCNQQPDELLQHAKPEWNIVGSVDEKITLLNSAGTSFQIQDIFPWKDELSDGIDQIAFCKSFLVQPDLFLRLRPGHEKAVQQKLTNAGIYFAEISPSCISLPNTSKIDAVIELDKEAVVQDLNSQNTGRFIAPLASTQSEASSIWDCCAASGGKSILAHDLLPSIDLTVSDIRESIIQNLKKRFAKAGIKNYRALVVDLGSAGYSWDVGKTLTPGSFDLIICDAPCSGSGTWSRTPEQLAFFNPDRIDHYAKLQRTISTNAIPYLKRGGRLVYITCSVFKKENEETIALIQDKFSMRAGPMEILKGYDKKADTLFAASLES